MNILRLLLRFALLNAVEEGGTGGGAVAAPATPAAEPAATPAAVVPATPAPTMLDAMFPKAAEPVVDAAADARARDELGRFAAKPTDPAAVPATPVAAAKPAVEPKPAEPEDLTKPPEGLTPKANERFQALANSNKELTGRLDQATRQVEYVKETFQNHGITREQFEQAAGFIGAINKGDFQGALQIIDAQRTQLALAMGKALPGVDALADFPDLRQKVDGLQMTEADALELARHRLGQTAMSQRAEQQRTQQQGHEAAQREHNEGLTKVDAFCKQMQASDLDYSAIETRLLPQLATLLEGVPPSLWESKVKAQYQLIKEMAAIGRPTTPAPTILRPTGQASPAAAPKSMAEAMWGKTLAA